MSQTLLAIFAIVLATLFALQQHQTIVHMRMKMIRNEVATQTTGVAVDRLEEIGTLAFDENTIGDKKLTSPNELTPGPPFQGDTQGNDIDDLHLAVADTFRVYGADTLWFKLETTITYASETQPDQVVTGPTKFKKATVKAYNLDIQNPDTVRISQTYACGSRCNW